MSRKQPETLNIYDVLRILAADCGATVIAFRKSMVQHRHGKKCLLAVRLTGDEKVIECYYGSRVYSDLHRQLKRNLVEGVIKVTVE